MTRKEQIDEFANSQVDCEFFNEDLHKGIIIGAKWADENPKESKQDIINNAKEFLRINFERGDDGYSCYYPDDLEKLLWQFDLWMR
jgi:hypothetical protein